LAAALFGLTFDSENILNVVADFVREHVSVRELTGRAEAALQLVVEAEIDIDLLIGRAIKRTGRGFGVAASRLGVIAKQDELSRGDMGDWTAPAEVSSRLSACRSGRR